MAELAQGTEIFFIDNNSILTEKIVRINCPKSIDPGTPSNDEHDTTNLCSISKEKYLGLTDWGSMTIALDYDQTDSSHQRLIELSEETPRQELDFVIGMPGDKTQPTLDSNGKFVLSVDRSWRRFTGQVSSVAITMEAGNIIPATVEILINKREKTLFAGRVE